MDLVRDSPELAETSASTLGSDLVALWNQMSPVCRHPVLQHGDPETALAGVLPCLAEPADRISRSDVLSVKVSGSTMPSNSFLRLLATHFLFIATDDRQGIMHAYAHEQISDLILHESTIPYPTVHGQKA
jgi:hypothetical protein